MGVLPVMLISCGLGKDLSWYTWEILQCAWALLCERETSWIT